MTDDQLDNVNGGTYIDSMEVANLLKKAGVKGTFLKQKFPGLKE